MDNNFANYFEKQVNNEGSNLGNLYGAGRFTFVGSQ